MKKVCLFLLLLCFVFHNMPMEHRGPIDGRSRSYKEIVRQVPRDVSSDELSDVLVADGPELTARQKVFWLTVCGALFVAPYVVPAGIHALRSRSDGVPSRAPAADALGAGANVTATHADNGTCCAEGFVDHGKGCESAKALGLVRDTALRAKDQGDSAASERERYYQVVLADGL